MADGGVASSAGAAGEALGGTCVLSPTIPPTADLDSPSTLLVPMEVAVVNAAVDCVAVGEFKPSTVAASADGCVGK